MTFVSVLGPRFTKNGEGGECRFVFDPPFSLRGVGPYDVHYTYVFTGNPYEMKMAPSVNAPGAPEGAGQGAADYSVTVEDVQLLNQQLDPKIRYKFAIVNGSTHANGVSSCDITKIMLWTRSVAQQH